MQGDFRGSAFPGRRLMPASLGTNGRPRKPDLLADAVKVVQGPDEDLSMGDGRRSIAFFFQGVLADHLEIRTSLQDKHVPVVIEKIEMTSSGNRRGAMVPSQTLFPQSLTGLGHEATGDTVIVHLEEILTAQTALRAEEESETSTPCFGWRDRKSTRRYHQRSRRPLRLSCLQRWHQSPCPLLRCRR